MRGNRIVPLFLSALLLSGVALCACSTQKNTESSSKIEVTTAAQTVTEQITTVETTAEEPSTEILTIKEQETAAPVTETVQNDSWKQIYSDYVNSLSNFDNYDYALVYVDDDDIPELYMHRKHRLMSSELCWIYNDEVYSQQLKVDGFHFYERENLFLSTGIQSGVQRDYVYKFHGSEAIEISNGVANRLMKGKEFFIWNEEYVTEDEYNSLRNETFDFSKAKTVEVFNSISELF